MSRQSPHPVTRGITSSPVHKPTRALTQSPRASLASIAPALTPAPSKFHYRSSSHTDSQVRRIHTDLPDDDYGGGGLTAVNTSITSPASAASSATTTPVKTTRRVTPASQPHSTTSSPSSTTTSLASFASASSPASLLTSSLQPADPSTWEDDDAVIQCRTCTNRFTLFLRKHHCRQCGRIFCDNCSRARRRLRGHSSTDELVRVCDSCDRRLALDDDEDERGHGSNSTSTTNKHQSSPSTPSNRLRPATPTHHTPTTITPTTITPTTTSTTSHNTDILSAISLAAEALDSHSSSSGRLPAANGSGGSTVDWAPLVASLLAEVECGERLRRVQDRIRDEMDAMLRVLVAEVAASGGKHGVELDVAG